MDTVLKVLRDPLFSVALAIVLAVLATRVGGCLVRLALAAGSIAAFIWLLVSFKPFENFVVAVVSAIATVLVVLLICLATIAVVAVVAIYVMHRAETRTPRQPREPRVPPTRTAAYSDDEEVARLERWSDDFQDLDARLVAIVESLADLDDEPSLFRGIGKLTAAYFSGLKPHLPEIRRIGQECDDLLLDLARHLPSSFTGVDETRLHTLVSTQTYLPSRAELEDWADDEIPWYAYWAVRALCVHRGWRRTAAVYAKIQYGRLQVLSCFEALT